MENPFKKFFSNGETDGKDKTRSSETNKFKKFDYADDDDEIFDLDDLFSEFHGNSFNFQGFPPGVLKQFEEILLAMQEFDDEPESAQRKKSFENKYNEFRLKTDQDLDGKLYADQLDTLLKRIQPSFKAEDKTKKIENSQKKIKIRDEDKIMDIIHGTFIEEVVPVKPRKRQVQKVPIKPHHFGGIPPFDLPPTSGGMWGKTVISIRKADGTTETRKMEKTPEGLTRTTITKTGADGTSSTQTFSGEGQNAVVKAKPTNENHAERNLIMHDGYKIPCLW